MKDVILNPTDLLVEPVTDYFTKNSQFTINQNLVFDTGVIVHAGKDIDKEWVGKVVYYQKGMATVVVVKGYGKFDLFPEHSKLLVRLDQDKNNY